MRCGLGTMRQPVPSKCSTSVRAVELRPAFPTAHTSSGPAAATAANRPPVGGTATCDRLQVLPFPVQGNGIEPAAVRGAASRPPTRRLARRPRHPTATRRSPGRAPARPSKRCRRSAPPGWPATGATWARRSPPPRRPPMRYRSPPPVSRPWTEAGGRRPEPTRRTTPSSGPRGRPRRRYRRERSRAAAPARSRGTGAVAAGGELGGKREGGGRMATQAWRCPLCSPCAPGTARADWHTRGAPAGFSTGRNLRRDYGRLARSSSSTCRSSSSSMPAACARARCREPSGLRPVAGQAVGPSQRLARDAEVEPADAVRLADLEASTRVVERRLGAAEHGVNA